MTTMDELKDKFSKLTDEEKVTFMKSVMPAILRDIQQKSREDDGRDDADCVRR